MLRAAVSILVGLPLLVPPGMCICQIVAPARHVPPPPSDAQQAAAHTPGRPKAHGNDCSCRKCAQKRHRADASAARSQAVRHAPGAPAPSDRGPCCPALQPSARAKTFVPIDPPPDAPGQVVGPVAFLGRPVASAAFPPTPPAGGPSAPLFLTHCSLLI